MKFRNSKGIGVKNVSKKIDTLNKIGFFLEMRRGEINEVSFCTKFQLENDANQPQLSPELGRNNRGGVSRNAELMFLQLGFKGCLGVFNRGDDLLPATSTFNFHSAKLVRTPIFLLSTRTNNYSHVVWNIVRRRMQRCCLTERMSLKEC